MTLGKTPHSDAEWARDVDRRLRRLEHPRQVILGTWSIHVSEHSGDLVADHIPTGRRRIIANADEIHKGMENE